MSPDIGGRDNKFPADPQGKGDCIGQGGDTDGGIGWERMGRGFWVGTKGGSGFEVKVRRERWEKGIWVEQDWLTQASWEGGQDGLGKE